MDTEHIDGNGTDRTSGSGVLHTVLRTLSDLSDRYRLSRRAGLSFSGARDFYEALGYNRTIETRDYLDLYHRDGIASRVVDTFPNATWGGRAVVVELDKPSQSTETEFEKLLKSGFRRLGVWDRLLRADILAGLGQFSILLIGADGKFDTELPRMRSMDDILWLQPMGQRLVDLVSVVIDNEDVRFGLPSEYSIKIGSEIGTGTGTGFESRSIRTVSRTVRVHHSRVIHIAQGLLDSEIFGTPTLMSIWNLLDDLMKVVGGGSEAAWKDAVPSKLFSYDKDAEVDEPQEKALLAAIEEMTHHLRPSILAKGISMTKMDGSSVNFSSNAKLILQLIGGSKSIPLRQLIGADASRVGGDQDQNDFDDSVGERQLKFGDPVLRQIIGRFQDVGALPEAEYDIVFPLAKRLQEGEKARVMRDYAQANVAQVKAGGSVVLDSDEMRRLVLSMDPRDDDDNDDDSDDANLDRANTASTVNDSLRSATVQSVINSHNQIEAIMLSSWDALGAAIDNAEIDDIDQLVEEHANDLVSPIEVELLDTLVDAGVDERQLSINAETWFRTSRVHSNNRFGDLITVGLASSSGGGALTAAGHETFNAVFDASNDAAIAWAEANAASQVVEITLGTQQGINEIIAIGLRSGAGSNVQNIAAIIGLRSDQVQAVENLATRLLDGSPGDIVFAGNRRITIPGGGSSQSFIEAQSSLYTEKLRIDRARLINHTATSWAANEGQRQMWVQAVDGGDLPADVKRTWFKNTDRHGELEGQIVGINEPFSPPIEPGEEPNCGCSQGLVRG